MTYDRVPPHCLRAFFDSGATNPAASSIVAMRFRCGALCESCGRTCTHVWGAIVNVRFRICARGVKVDCVVVGVCVNVGVALVVLFVRKSCEMLVCPCQW